MVFLLHERFTEQAVKLVSLVMNNIIHPAGHVITVPFVAQGLDTPPTPPCLLVQYCPYSASCQSVISELYTN